MYYNDYNMDNQNKALAVYNMVKELNEQNPDVGGRPLIDGIGMQGHYRLNTSIENVSASMKRFASLGVEVSITELDVQAGTNSVLNEMQALGQALLYAELFALFKENASSLGRVTIWGLDDGTSWRKESSPTLFDHKLQKKLTYHAAIDPESFLAENQSRFIREIRQTDARFGSPALDQADPLWQNAPVIPVNQNITAWQGAQGEARALWDEQYLYVFIAVSNAELNKANPELHEQDSVEIFIDEGNHKVNHFQIDEGQYRINFDNEQSFNPPSIAAGFESKTVVSERSYTVAAKIPFRTIKPQEGMLIGFDLQINGASSQGIRQSIAVWNDISGAAFQNPSGFGVLRLTN
jgi:endo-1,4-beta-xylanase